MKGSNQSFKYFMNFFTLFFDRDLKKLELKSNMLGNQDREMNYDNLKNSVFYDLDLNGVSQDFDPGALKKFCANKGFK